MCVDVRITRLIHSGTLLTTHSERERGIEMERERERERRTYIH